MTDTHPPTVTVLMPVYNAAGYIIEAARSILDEDIDGLELLVIDDGSTDAGMTELATLDDPRIRVVGQENAGLVAALNRGLDEARGEYLARMDADDISVTGRLKAQLAWMRGNPDAVVCGTDYEMFGGVSGRVRMPGSDTACRQRLLMSTCHCGASVMMRRAVVEAEGLRFDPAFTHAEDYEFFTRLAQYGRIGNLPIVGYRYRIHARQVSTVHGSVQREVHLRIARHQSERVEARSIDDAVLSSLLWPEAKGWGAVVECAGAAWTVLARRPGVQTARFCGRKIVESAAAARASH